MISLVVLVPIAVVALLVAWSQSRSSVADAGWPSAGLRPGLVGPADHRRATTAETVLALGRVEGRLLFWSPWFAIGLGFLAMIVLMYAGVPEDGVQMWTEFAELSPWFVHPLVGMVVLASHRAMTRAGRDGADEVFGVCPTRPEVRTLGHLAASWLPVVTSAAYLVGFVLLLVVRSPDIHGSFSSDSVADIGGALLLCVGGVALGVALGLWVRFPLAPVVVVVAIVFLSTGLSGIGGRGWNPYVQLSTAPTLEAPSPVFADRPVWWHVVWIGSLVLLVGVIALLRDRRDRPVLLTGVGTVVVAVVAVFGVTREMPAASASAIADRVARPEAHQDCIDIDDRFEVCVFPFHDEVADRIVDDVTPVAMAIPDEVGTLTIRQVYEEPIEQLPPEVRRRLPRPVPDRPSNEIPFSSFATSDGFTGQRGDLALAAAGLPTRPDATLMPLVVAGEARGVVALWLSVRGLDIEQQLKRTSASEADSNDPFDNGSIDGLACAVPGVVWSRQDLAAARAVIQLPEETVRQAVAADWSRWTDPETGTDELLEHLGLPTVGPFDDVTPRPGNPC